MLRIAGSSAHIGGAAVDHTKYPAYRDITLHHGLSKVARLMNARCFGYAKGGGGRATPPPDFWRHGKAARHRGANLTHSPWGKPHELCMLEPRTRKMPILVLMVHE